MIPLALAALGAEAVARIVKTVAVSDDLLSRQRPAEEHDSARRCRRAEGVLQDRLLRREPELPLPGPADPSVTKRVITIMLAEEH